MREQVEDAELESREAHAVVLGAYIIAWTAAAVQSWRVLQKGGDAFRVGDWLINYSGGFVRRGLAGQVLLFFSRAIPGGLLPGVLMLQLGLYALLLVLAYRMLVPHLQASRGILFLALSPATFLFEALNRQAFRKELLGLVLLAAFCRGQQIAASKNETLSETWSWLAALVVPLLILNHEISALLVPYVLLAGRQFSLRRSSIALLSLSALAFVVVALNSGSAEVASEIRASLRGLVPDASLAKPGGAGAIGALRHSSESAVRDVGSRLFDEGYSYPIRYALVLLLTYLGFVANRAQLTSLMRTNHALLLLFCGILGTVLLCVVAKDWGRFIHSTATALTLVLLADSPKQRQTSAFGPWSVLAAAVLYGTLWRVPIARPSLEKGALSQLCAARL